MKYSSSELKEIWSRSDAYYQFTFDDYKTFGSRLRKWRELNGITQREIAEAIYRRRENLGLSVSSVNGIMRTFGKWESKDTDVDTPFSMCNLKILKQLLHADYEFLFCEIDTPHRITRKLASYTGLNYSSIEKLANLSKDLISEEGDNLSNDLASGILKALDKIISDDDLLCYMSYFITRISYESEADAEDEKADSISVLKPYNGLSTEDAILDGDTTILNDKEQFSVYLMTIAHKLCNLRDREEKISPRIFTAEDAFKGKPICEAADCFGVRLKKWREYAGLTQADVANSIFTRRKELRLETPPATGILRTYQNWEAKTSIERDIRISMTDIRVLRDVMDCDYEYIFGEINSLKVATDNPRRTIGLSRDTVKKLHAFALSLQGNIDKVPAYAGNVITMIDLILTDNELLSDLAYFLTDLEFYPSMYQSDILKPVIIIGFPQIQSEKEYADRLFVNESPELRNIFLPSINKHLLSLRKKYHHDNEAIVKHTDRKV